MGTARWRGHRTTAERRHVLYPTQDRNIRLGQHGVHLLGIEVGDILWRNDEQRSIDAKLLGEVLLHVGRAGG